MRSWTRGYFTEKRCVAVGSVVAIGDVRSDVNETSGAIPADLVLLALTGLPREGPGRSPVDRTEQFRGSPEAGRELVDHWATAAIANARPGPWIETDTPPDVRHA